MALVAERGSSVRLSFGSGKVTIEAGTEGQARARETVLADFSGDQTTIAFSPQYLLDGLGAALAAASGGPSAPIPAARAARSGTLPRRPPKGGSACSSPARPSRP